jgi:hypothetical protein
MNREDLRSLVALVRQGSTAAIDSLCNAVETMAEPFDKKTYMRDYMREYRRGVRRRNESVNSAA